jgi:H+/Cl- antiporter ClcA
MTAPVVEARRRPRIPWPGVAALIFGLVVGLYELVALIWRPWPTITDVAHTYRDRWYGLAAIVAVLVGLLALYGWLVWHFLVDGR